MNAKNISGIVFLLLFMLGGLFVVSNQQNISDWWFLRSYQPPAEIAALNQKAGFSEHGTDLFYVSDPTLNNKEEFNINCPFEEKTIVLGCYDGKQIFILSIDDPQLEGVQTVTAAHEMLHAAYQRLSDDEKTRINRLVNEQFAQTTEQRIKDLVAEYDQNDQALINNELHSILPTELRDLSPELEQYYSQYFNDRQKVVTAAKEYESVFLGITAEIDSMRATIDSLKTNITSLEATLATLAEQITIEKQELDQLRSSGQLEEYNQQVPGFNNLVRRHNDIIAQLQSTVAQHNQLVNEVNAKALQHNELIQTIDSNYQEL